MLRKLFKWFFVNNEEFTKRRIWKLKLFNKIFFKDSDNAS